MSTGVQHADSAGAAGKPGIGAQDGHTCWTASTHAGLQGQLSDAAPKSVAQAPKRTWAVSSTLPQALRSAVSRVCRAQDRLASRVQDEHSHSGEIDGGALASLCVAYVHGENEKVRRLMHQIDLFTTC